MAKVDINDSLAARFARSEAERDRIGTADQPGTGAPPRSSRSDDIGRAQARATRGGKVAVMGRDKDSAPGAMFRITAVARYASRADVQARVTSGTEDRIPG